MRLRVSWTAIGTVAAILALALAGWLGYTSGTLAPPKLEFGFGAVKGLSGGDLRNAGLSKNGPVTYLVMTTSTRDATSAVFMVPFYLANRSSRALRDVLVRLNYPTRVAARFDSVKLLDPPGEWRLNPEYTKLRTVTTSGATTTTEFQIPILRRGDGIILGDMFVLGDLELSRPPATKQTDIRLLTFPERLREHIDLLDVLRVKAFAASAEAGPYTADLTVIWAHGSSGKESTEVIGDRITNAAWGPYRLKPGRYFKWPWEKLSETEFFEFLNVPLSRGLSKSGDSVYVQHIEQTGMVAFSSSMPPWDYWGPIGK